MEKRGVAAEDLESRGQDVKDAVSALPADPYSNTVKQAAESRGPCCEATEKKAELSHGSQGCGCCRS